MKATVLWAGSLLAIALATPISLAGPYDSPGFPANGSPSELGGACAPKGHLFSFKHRADVPQYWFRPTGEPMIPFSPAINCLGPYYVTHPYVRGPRDFFMWRENMEDQMRREQRPVLIP
jgi:hypothetical protein